MTPQTSPVQIGCTGVRHTKQRCVAAAASITLACPVLRGLSRCESAWRCPTGRSVGEALCSSKQTLQTGRHGIKLTQLHNPRLELACSHSEWTPATPQTLEGTRSQDSCVTSLFALAQEKVLLCQCQLRPHQGCSRPAIQSLTSSPHSFLAWVFCIPW